MALLNRNKNLIKKLKNGDVKALNIIFNKYRQSIFYFTYQHIRSKEDTEELILDVFLKIWENREQINEDLSFDNYIYTITKNNLINFLRKKSPVFTGLDFCTPESITDHQTEESIYLNDLSALTKIAISNLPPKRQQIFELSRLSGLSNQEIAKKMNISVKTVEAQMTKALHFLKKYLHSNSDYIS
ncbi:MAG: RNA polymerase sigma-70 factor [Candidatus Cyclobacteriaceae bacterium M3_2C_046]